MSLILGAVSLIWHIANLVLYFTNNDNTEGFPITDGMYVATFLIMFIYSLYWAEMVLNIILILTTITLVVKVDFVPLTPEEIERVEIEELKHRMQIKEH
jgi:phosphatidylserine synthase